MRRTQCATMPRPVRAKASALIKKWHDHGRLRYAVTPRFAITSTRSAAPRRGRTLQIPSRRLMQTHLSESAGEIEMVKSLFPNARDYTDVYDRFGLLGRRSLFGHGIHLSERECARLSETGSVVVHCPTSNTFLGSGLMRHRPSSRPAPAGTLRPSPPMSAAASAIPCWRRWARPTRWRSSRAAACRPSTRSIWRRAAMPQALDLNPRSAASNPAAGPISSCSIPAPRRCSPAGRSCRNPLKTCCSR